MLSVDPGGGRTAGDGADSDNSSLEDDDDIDSDDERFKTDHVEEVTHTGHHLLN